MARKSVIEGIIGRRNENDAAIAYALYGDQPDPDTGIIKGLKAGKSAGKKEAGFYGHMNVKKAGRPVKCYG